MSSIVVLAMEGAGDHAAALLPLRSAGHDVRVVEPRWPDCQAALGELDPALIVVDGARAPSHGRSTAGWLAARPGLRTVPVLFVDVPDRDVSKVKKEVPRAQFATWSSLAGAGERLLKRT